MVGQIMKIASKKSSGRKWHQKYLPFVAKSPDLQVDWLVVKLAALRESGDRGETGILTKEELAPYTRILLGNVSEAKGAEEDLADNDQLAGFLEAIGDEELLTMIECAEIYDVPKLFRILREISVKQAVVAMKKVPPPYERNPLLIMDRVFHSIREKSVELLEEATREVLASDDAPDDFADNYERFKEIVLDENILSIMYPKAK
jgi:hypothetical protein